MPPVVWWWATAGAEPPSPARLCADAADGREIELCLQVVSEHPDALYEVAAALVAQLDAAAEPDRRLLEALLLLSGPQGVAGVQRLGELGDPRGLPALVHAVRNREPEVAAAAARALVRWREQWPALSRWIADPALPEEVRLAAAEALTDTGDSAAAAMVEQALLRPQVSRQVRRRVVGWLSQRFPSRTPPARASSNDAAAWLAVGSGVGMGYAMGALGYFGPEELWPVGAITGATAGISVGWIYGRAWPMDPAEGALITVSGLGAGGAGALLGAAIAPDSLEGPLVGGLLGEAVGFSSAIALRRGYPGTTRDVVEAAALAGLTTAAVDAWQVYRPPANPRTRPLVDGTTLGLGLGLGLAIAPALDVEGRDAGLVTSTAVAGLAAAWLVPVEPADRAPLLIAGPSAGAVLGLMLSDVVNLGTDVWTVGLAGAGAGAAIGGGAGLLASDDPSLTNGLALGGSTVGFVTAAALTHRQQDPVDDRDVLLVAASTTWAAAGTAVAGFAGDQQLSEEEVGAVLVASGLVASAATALSPELDVPAPLTLSASSVGLWGAYAGGAIGEIAWGRPAVSGLIGTQVGLITGGVLVSDVVGTPPMVVAMANAGGVVGAAGAGLVASGVSRDRRVVLGASLAGAGLGAIAGGTLGRRWHRSGGRRDLAGVGRVRLPGRWSVVPHPSGIRLVVDQW